MDDQQRQLNDSIFPDRLTGKTRHFECRNTGSNPVLGERIFFASDEVIKKRLKDFGICVGIPGLIWIVGMIYIFRSTAI